MGADAYDSEVEIVGVKKPPEAAAAAAAAVPPVASAAARPAPRGRAAAAAPPPATGGPQLPNLIDLLNIDDDDDDDEIEVTGPIPSRGAAAVARQQQQPPPPKPAVAAAADPSSRPPKQSAEDGARKLTRVNRSLGMARKREHRKNGRRATSGAGSGKGDGATSLRNRDANRGGGAGVGGARAGNIGRGSPSSRASGGKAAAMNHGNGTNGTLDRREFAQNPHAASAVNREQGGTVPGTKPPPPPYLFSQRSDGGRSIPQQPWPNAASRADRRGDAFVRQGDARPHQPQQSRQQNSVFRWDTGPRSSNAHAKAPTGPIPENGNLPPDYSTRLLSPSRAHAGGTPGADSRGSDAATRGLAAGAPNRNQRRLHTGGGSRRTPARRKAGRAFSSVPSSHKDGRDKATAVTLLDDSSSDSESDVEFVHKKSPSRTVGSALGSPLRHALQSTASSSKQASVGLDPPGTAIATATLNSTPPRSATLLRQVPSKGRSARALQEKQPHHPQASPRRGEVRERSQQEVEVRSKASIVGKSSFSPSRAASSSGVSIRKPSSPTDTIRPSHLSTSGAAADTDTGRSSHDDEDEADEVKGKEQAVGAATTSVADSPSGRTKGRKKQTARKQCKRPSRPDTGVEPRDGDSSVSSEAQKGDEFEEETDALLGDRELSLGEVDITSADEKDETGNDDESSGEELGLGSECNLLQESEPEPLFLGPTLAVMEDTIFSAYESPENVTAEGYLVEFEQPISKKPANVPGPLHIVDALCRLTQDGVTGLPTWRFSVLSHTKCVLYDFQMNIRKSTVCPGYGSFLTFLGTIQWEFFVVSSNHSVPLTYYF